MNRYKILVKLIYASGWYYFCSLLLFILAVASSCVVGYFLWGHGWFGVLGWIIATIIIVWVMVLLGCLLTMLENDLEKLIEKLDREDECKEEEGE